MIIEYHRDFLKNFKKLPGKVREKFKEIQLLVEMYEFEPALNKHALKGRWLGYRSINVTGHIRAIFKRDRSRVLFVAIDSHSSLYG